MLDFAYILVAVSVLCWVLAFYPRLRTALGGGSMDYIFAGVAALFLFGYLVYALLRPERF